MSENIFISYFTVPGMSQDQASSAAGDRVQKDIGESIEKCFGETQFIVMPTIRSFPFGPLWVNSLLTGSRKYIGILNIPILKMFVFSIGVVCQLIQNKPNNIFVWNSYFFQNIAVWSYKKIVRKKPKVIIFIQDVNKPKKIKELQLFLDLISIRLVNKFCDLCVPVSKDIILDFGIKTNFIKVIGGISEEDIHLSDVSFASNNSTNANYYVMGGAIEPYNGVADLAKSWPACGSAGFLHIYGDGSKANKIIEISNSNKFVRYFGKVTRDEYIKAANSSIGVIVLRYNYGLDSKYFFPSKFLEACVLNTSIICNKFTNFPEELSDYVFLLNDDLSDLKDKLSITIQNQKNKNINSERIKYVRENYTWENSIKKIKMELYQ